MMKKILENELVIMDELAKDHHFLVDLVYADANHPLNIFKTAIYKKPAPFVLHETLAGIVCLAAKRCYEQTGLKFSLKDGYRPIEAQAKMQETDIVRANPHWLEEPRLLSPPGAGGHPRAMAVDITLIDENDQDVDMGTVFDYLTEDRNHNPAARDYINFTDNVDYNRRIVANRAILTDAMMAAAQELKTPLLPLPQEWWDFRLTHDFYKNYAPISDVELPPHKQIILT